MQKLAHMDLLVPPFKIIETETTCSVVTNSFGHAHILRKIWIDCFPYLPETFNLIENGFEWMKRPSNQHLKLVYQELQAGRVYSTTPHMLKKDKSAIKTDFYFFQFTNLFPCGKLQGRHVYENVETYHTIEVDSIAEAQKIVNYMRTVHHYDFEILDESESPTTLVRLRIIDQTKERTIRSQIIRKIDKMFQELYFVAVPSVAPIEAHIDNRFFLYDTFPDRYFPNVCPFGTFKIFGNKQILKYMAYDAEQAQRRAIYTPNERLLVSYGYTSFYLTRLIISMILRIKKHHRTSFSLALDNHVDQIEFLKDYKRQLIKVIGEKQASRYHIQPVDDQNTIEIIDKDSRDMFGRVRTFEVDDEKRAPELAALKPLTSEEEILSCNSLKVIDLETQKPISVPIEDIPDGVIPYFEWEAAKGSRDVSVKKVVRYFTMTDLVQKDPLVIHKYGKPPTIIHKKEIPAEYLPFSEVLTKFIADNKYTDLVEAEKELRSRISSFREMVGIDIQFNLFITIYPTELVNKRELGNVNKVNYFKQFCDGAGAEKKGS